LAKIKKLVLYEGKLKCGKDIIVRRKYHHFSDKVEMEYRLF